MPAKVLKDKKVSKTRSPLNLMPHRRIKKYKCDKKSINYFALFFAYLMWKSFTVILIIGDFFIFSCYI